MPGRPALRAVLACARERGFLVLAQVALEGGHHAAQVGVLRKQAFDLLDGTDDGRVILAAKTTANLWEARAGELARQLHGYHARPGHGLQALRSPEIVQLDIEVRRHLALDGFDVETLWSCAHQVLQDFLSELLGDAATSN